jgi:hypothetical protein
VQIDMNRPLGGRRVGRASAGEFAAVTAAAGAGTLVLALLFSGAATASATGQVASPQATTVTPTTSAATSSSTTTATSTPTPEEVTVSISEQVAIPFASTTVDDPTLLTGAKVVRTSGRAGVKTVTWLVRTRGGVEVGRNVSGEQVTTPAVDEVVAVGTAVPAPPPAERTTAPPAPKSTPTPKVTTPPSTGTCDPNYAGACVPIASDVDCAGGKGNGPAYVRGPVRVIGEDIYELDADHDGIGCE